MRNMICILFILVTVIYSETLFEVKDASNNTVLDVSTDGIRIMNYPDTLMIISSSEIRANIDNSKGLSRTFSITTPSSVKGFKDIMKVTADSTRFWISDSGSGFGVSSQTALKEKSVATNFLKVSNANTEMREGTAGDRYTDFSPDNIFLGLNSGIITTPGSPSLYSGRSNIFLGNESGKVNTSGYDNVLLGDSAGISNTTGFRNVFIGSSAGKGNSYGEDNIYIGYKSGYNENGGQNIFIGNYSGYNNTSSQNLFIGEYSGEKNTTGNRNSFLGFFAGQDNITGGNNTYVGQMAGINNLQSSNTMVGYWSGGQNIDGTSNSFLGYRSGVQSTGSNNVFLGYQAGEGNLGSGSVMIGYQAGMSSGSISDKLYIANSSTSTPLIYGEFDNDFVKINGKLGVGINPMYRIHAIDETTSNDNPAIFGKHNVTDTWGVGVKGEGGARGVVGYASATGDYHIHGISGSASGSGGVRTGVYGTASGGTTNWAGYFSGNVRVTGTINPTKVDIKIDHPSDPENKILSHSSVNSSEMLNVYNGNVILDSEGKAFVSLPEWFEAFNTDFRYQLTPVGAYAQLYISEEISENKFEISGGKPGLKVSWQVTGTRNDNYAKDNPIEVETTKKQNEKGYYLHPESFGQPKEMGIEYQVQKRAEKIENE